MQISCKYHSTPSRYQGEYYYSPQNTVLNRGTQNTDASHFDTWARVEGWVPYLPTGGGAPPPSLPRWTESRIPVKALPSFVLCTRSKWWNLRRFHEISMLIFAAWFTKPMQVKWASEVKPLLPFLTHGHFIRVNCRPNFDWLEGCEPETSWMNFRIWFDQVHHYRKPEKYTVHKKRNRLIAELHKINKGVNAVKSNKSISDADRIRQLADLQRQKDEVMNYILSGCQVPPFSSFFRNSSFFPPFWAKCPPCPPF